jgi:hypothetical protein
VTLSTSWRVIVVAWVVAALLLAIVWSVLDPIYFTNDDVTFRLGIEGTDIPGEPPTGLLLTTHAALGIVAATLQAAVPFLPVWDLILSATLVAGLAVFGAVSWCRIGSGSAVRWAAVIAFAAAVVPFATGLQFTISAVLCGGAAALLALTELFHAATPRRSVLVFAGALLVVGFLVRPMGAEAGALSTTVLFGFSGLFGPRRWTRLWRLSAAAATMVVLFAGLNAADAALYPERGNWADYYRYHWRNVALIEWGGVATNDQAEAIRAAAGWTDNDWDALRDKWGTDANRFGFRQMNDATAAAARTGVQDSPLSRLMLRGAATGRDAIDDVLPQVTFVSVLALILAVCLGNVRAVGITCGTLLLFLLMCAAIQTAFKELPFRLLAPLQACLIAVVIAGIADHRRTASRLRVAIALSLGLAVTIYQGRIAAAQAIDDEDHTGAIARQIAEVLALDPSLLVVHSDAFPAEHWWRPFRAPRVRLPVIKLQRNNQSPRFQHFLASTGRSSLLRSICEDPSALVIANPGDLDTPTRYMAEHDGIEASWTLVYDGSFRVWRCVRAGGVPLKVRD